MDPVSRLEAIEEIKQLKGRYFYYLDSKNWDEWRKVFTDDAVMDVSGQFPDAPDKETFVYRGGDTIVASVSPAVALMVTAHHGHMPLITIEDSDRATGVWAMEDNLIMPDGLRMLGYGHYHEKYRREGGAWKIAKTRLSRLKVLIVPAGAATA